MRAFKRIHLCDKMIDAISRFVDILIVVEVDFLLLEHADQPFSVSVLPRPPSVGSPPKSQHHAASTLRYSHLKDTAHLDRSDESPEPCRVKLALRGATSEIGSSAD